MSIWKKKEVAKEIIQDISKRYSCELLTASILSRRGIIEGKDILYFTENDQRYLHNPFLFENMEDAVDRILDAKDEEEKVLIFGDRDVDGITSTTILYQCLKDLGLDVQYKLPEGDDAYGITKEVIDNFAENYGSLIITVDCGISNNEEINHAIITKLDRTTTILEARGGYSGMSKKVVMVSFTMRQYSTLINIVNIIDKTAFVSIHRAHEINGEGWTRPSPDPEKE